MTPETPIVVAPAAPDDAAAALDETAVTLDALGESVEELSELSRDRADEILREVRECRSMVSQLSQSLPALQQTESPSMQQALIQLTALQTAVEKIQQEVEALQGSTRLQPEVVNPQNENQDGPRENLENPGTPNTPTLNPSVTQPPPPPQKKPKRYVKI